MVSQDFIKKLIEATDMYALVSPYVKLEKTGSGYKGLCPFHDEKTPSFQVSQEKHLAHCFGCGGGGNPLKFLMEIEHISFKDALIKLAKLNGVELPKDFNNDTKVDIVSQKYYEMNSLARDLYVRNLLTTNSGQEALDYLHKRGLTDDIIKEFEIGLAPASNDILYKFLKQSNYTELDMIDVGLVRSSNQEYYDVFKKRVMFPLKNERGDIIGFSGRTYLAHDDGAKYLNTAETKIFRKSYVLYNLDKAAKEIAKKNRVILFEGYMDVIAAYRSELKEAICSMGTALTSSQIKIIKKYTKNVIVCYDNDNAGVNASHKAIDLLLAEGMNIKLVRLDKSKDADEFVSKYGTLEFKNFFESHIVNAIDYSLDDLTKRLNKDDYFETEALKESFFNLLRKFNSRTLEDTYIRRLAKILGVAESSLFLDFNQKNKRPFIVTPQTKTKPKFELDENLIYFYRLFEYAKASKVNAIKIDRVIEEYRANMILSEDNMSLWSTLIDEYYEFYDVYDEETFIKILKRKDLFTFYYGNIYQLDKSIPADFDAIDLEGCIGHLKYLCLTKQRTLISQANIDNITKLDKLQKIALEINRLKK